MLKTPASIKPHIVLLGRTNVGKSTLMNAIARQPLALTSDVPGTTTDPVRKSYELLPFGPVVFVDTGGLDDPSVLGDLRVSLTKRELQKADFVILVAQAGLWGEPEAQALATLEETGTGHLVVVNKTDLDAEWRAPREAIYVSSTTDEGIEELRLALIERLEKTVKRVPSVLGDLIDLGDSVVLVCPIDTGAPKGRLILPQVMAIRDVLDNDAVAVVIKEDRIAETIAGLDPPPKLLVCDSQVIELVARETPPHVAVTTFSILFARMKADLETFVRGLFAIEEIEDGDKVLIAEACTHHPLEDDIGTIKIPRWMRAYTGKKIEFVKSCGKDYPEDLEQFKMIIHCGGCMLTARHVEVRVEEATRRGVPITNYGLAISYLTGVLERALDPFPELRRLVHEHRPAAGRDRR